MVKRVRRPRVPSKRQQRTIDEHFGRTVLRYYQNGSGESITARRLNLFDYQVTEWEVMDLFDMLRGMGIHRKGEFDGYEEKGSCEADGQEDCAQEEED